MNCFGSSHFVTNVSGGSTNDQHVLRCRESSHREPDAHVGAHRTVGYPDDERLRHTRLDRLRSARELRRSRARARRATLLPGADGVGSRGARSRADR